MTVSHSPKKASPMHTATKSIEVDRLLNPNLNDYADLYGVIVAVDGHLTETVATPQITEDAVRCGEIFAAAVEVITTHGQPTKIPHGDAVILVDLAKLPDGRVQTVGVLLRKSSKAMKTLHRSLRRAWGCQPSEAVAS